LLTLTTIPIFFELLLVILLGSVDTFMLSRISDEAVAAVGFVSQIINTTNIIFAAITIGTTIIASRHFGSKQFEELNRIFAVAITMVSIIGAITSIFIFYYAQNILFSLDLKPQLISDAKIYLQIVGSASLFQAVSMAASAMLRSCNLAKYPSIITGGVNVINAMANYILIFGAFGIAPMGVKGAAIATAISKITAMIALLFILKYKLLPNFSLGSFKPFPISHLYNTIKLGFPAGGEQLSYCLSQICIIYFINQMGTESLAARTYTVNIVMFSYLYSMSVASASAIIKGQLIGRNKQNATYNLGLFTFKKALFIGFFISLVFAIIGWPLMNFLTNNPVVINLVIKLLLIDIILELGRTANLVLIYGMRATGYVRFPIIVGILCMWLIATAGSYIFGISLGLGVIGVWIAQTLDECIRGIIMFSRWKSKRWQHKN
ncbi:MAG: MATE family efflux transporter, partial [Lentisphaeria bacterium]